MFLMIDNYDSFVYNLKAILRSWEGRSWSGEVIRLI